VQRQMTCQDAAWPQLPNINRRSQCPFHPIYHFGTSCSATGRQRFLDHLSPSQLAKRSTQLACHTQMIPVGMTTLEPTVVSGPATDR